MSIQLHSIPRQASLIVLCLVLGATPAAAQKTAKPVLHGKHWVAVTGKPLAATAGAMTFTRGGNAVDAACAMLAATSTMWDTLGWGGETQALIYNPHTGEVKGINALGVAPTGATVEFFREKGMVYPPEYGPLAAVTPGTPGGLMVMLAEFGTLSLAQVLEPAMEMAAGYPIEKSQADNMERRREVISRWSASAEVFLPHLDEENPADRAAPVAGEIFRQPKLLATLEKLVVAEAEALAAGKDRKAAIYAAYDRFYRGDIAEEIVRRRGSTAACSPLEDLDQLAGLHRGAGDHELQGHRRLQAHDVGPGSRSAAGAQSPRGDRSPGHGLQQRPLHPHPLPGHEPRLRRSRLLLRRPLCSPGRAHRRPALQGVCRAAPRDLINPDENDPEVRPGDPYPFQGEENPFLDLLENWSPIPPTAESDGIDGFQQARLITDEEAFVAGTTSIQAADAEGWVVSVTPSGAWIPAFIAGEHRDRSVPADAELRPRRGDEPVQRRPARASARGRP
jgi:gamma-glutamyltranspeptidase/glutathione hydrolase